MKRCLLFLLLSSATSSGFGQSTNATISGGVADPSGNLVTGADVEIQNDSTGVVYASKTNQVGMYIVPILPPGHYHVQVAKPGFKTIIKADVVLNVQSAVALNFVLPVGATSESITVDTGSPALNTVDASVSAVVDHKFVEEMPLNGRSFQDLISMTPGVVTQSPQSTSQTVGVGGDFSVNGQRTQSNYYTVDGVSANVSAGNAAGVAGTSTGGSLPGSTALGTTQALVSIDALQEFRVQSSTYSAVFGRSPGGQFSLVTRSGTNAPHGSAYNYLRNNFFDANDWFNDHYGKPIAALRQNDFGGTFSGPVWLPKLYDGKDRSFFFVSYEGLRLQQPTAATIQYVPDLAMRQQAVAAMQPILNAFPKPNGIDYGNSSSPNLAQFIAPFSLPSSINSTSLRFDQTFSPKLVLFFRFGNTPTYAQSRSNFALTNTTSNVLTYTVGANSQLSQAITNEFRLGYSRADASQVGEVDSFGGATPTNLAADMGAGGYQSALPVIAFSISGIGSPLMAQYDARNRGRQWNLVNTTSVLIKQHFIRFGIDYRYIKSPISPPDVEPYAVFSTPAQILSGAPSSPYVFRFVPATPQFRQLALFVNDEWRVHRRLNLSFGLRWEVNPPPTEQHGQDAYTLLGDINHPSTLTVAPRGTRLWNTYWYDFAPRVGAVWTAHDQSGMETVVRAGGGVFFDSPNEIAANGFSGLGFRAQKLYTGAKLPYTADQLNVSVAATAPYIGATVTAFPAHLQLPYTLQWNLSVQQALGAKQSITFSYVAAAGRRLLGLQQKSLTALNPNFGTVQYFASGNTSNYQSLQVQFQRSIAKGVQALASYSWSHAIDFGSNASALPLIRGNADFDVRNNVQGGVSWELPNAKVAPLWGVLLHDWSVDLRANFRTAFPVTLGGNTITDPTTGSQYSGGLNVDLSRPIYLYDPSYPGGKVINKAAFSTPATGVSGNAPRNFVRGFGANQQNLAVHRSIHLHDPLVLQFRAEMFNAMNHPNFGYVDPSFTSATFGQATKMLNSSLGTMASQYQQGGARSMQFALKLQY